MEDYTGSPIDGDSSMEEHGWRHMAKRRFWQPSGGGYHTFYAVFNPSDGSKQLWKECSSGKEREEFIREQSHLIRRYETEQEYLDFYRFLCTMTA